MDVKRLAASFVVAGRDNGVQAVVLAYERGIIVAGAAKPHLQ